MPHVKHCARKALSRGGGTASSSLSARRLPVVHKPFRPNIGKGNQASVNFTRAIKHEDRVLATSVGAVVHDYAAKLEKMV